MIKILIIFSLFLALVLESDAFSEERFLQQPLDHFDAQNNSTWIMNYFVNAQNYQEGGPIFVYVGGDYQAGTFWLEHGHMYDIAVNHNGLIVGTETRFFGDNHPTSDTSTRNLRFLSTEQILADLAHLLDHIKTEDSRLENAKVVLVGTMLAGNFATWFRVKYPHHAIGVWSSSSHVEARFNFVEYYDEIGNDIRNFGSNGCYSRIWRAFRTMQNLIESGRSSIIDEMFHLCHPLDVNDEFEVQHFFEAIAESISIGILNGGYNYVSDMCHYVINEEISNDLIAFAEWFSMEHRATGCFEMTFQEIVEFVSEPEWDSFGVISGRRQFLYLACTEYGWFATTESENQPFGNRIRIGYFTELCRRVFGEWIVESISENIDKTNVNFGGSTPGITNAFFTNGGMDPFRVVNIQSNIGETVEAQTLPLYGHSRDLYSLSDNDPPSLRNAKLRVSELIAQWLED